MWNRMAGWPYSAMNNGGMNGPGYGDMPWDDQWMGIGPGPGYGPGPCPWDGYQPWMPPKKEMDCCAILRCIHQCMRHYMNHMPYDDHMAGYGMGYGPAAGYGAVPGTPSVPATNE